MKRIAILALVLIALCAADASAFAPRARAFRVSAGVNVGLSVFRPRTVVVAAPVVFNQGFRQRAFVGNVGYYGGVQQQRFLQQSYGYAQQLGYSQQFLPQQSYAAPLQAPLPCQQQALQAPMYAAPLAAGTCGNALSAPLSAGCGSALSAPLSYGGGFQSRGLSFRVRSY